MANPSRRGSSGEPVRNSMQGGNYTPWTNTHFVLPYGLRLQQKVGMSTITNVSASGGTVTYTAANNYSAGNTVSIYDVNPVAYNLQSVTIASASSTQFTVTNAATGTYVSGGTAQQTGAITVTIPAGINFVYAIVAGGGGGGSNGGGGGGGAGGIAWGWTLATSSCIVGAGASYPTTPGYSRYGNIIAGYGGYANGNLGAAVAGILGGAGGGGGAAASNGLGSTNYWGIPLAGATGGFGTSAGISSISGSGAGSTATAAGGSGLAGGGARAATGGSGFNIATGVATTGGASSASTNGGGGGGIGGNGSAGSGTTGGGGGLGGGGGGSGSVTSGRGGDGLIYLFY